MRVYRPGFRSIIDDLDAGRANALLAEDLDRVLRDPRDAEDLIDCVQSTGANVDSLSGSLRLTNGGTDAEIPKPLPEGAAAVRVRVLPHFDHHSW